MLDLDIFTWNDIFDQISRYIPSKGMYVSESWNVRKIVKFEHLIPDIIDEGRHK